MGRCHAGCNGLCSNRSSFGWICAGRGLLLLLLLQQCSQLAVRAVAALVRGVVHKLHKLFQFNPFCTSTVSAKQCKLLLPLVVAATEASLLCERPHVCSGEIPFACLVQGTEDRLDQVSSWILRDRNWSYTILERTLFFKSYLPAVLTSLRMELDISFWLSARPWLERGQVPCRMQRPLQQPEQLWLDLCWAGAAVAAAAAMLATRCPSSSSPRQRSRSQAAQTLPI